MLKKFFASAVRETFSRGYNIGDLRADALAGLTVGIVAIPLSMALAIASGVPPQYGLYTGIVAGIVIALTGGARYNISGPTAAFVVILLPITQQFGIGGLMIATIMAGIIQVCFGLGGIGQLIRFIPYPVTTGFTAGIATVIAVLQIKDFLGLHVELSDAHLLEVIGKLASAIPTAEVAEVGIGSLTLLMLIFWHKLKINIPSHLVALLFSTIVAYVGGNVFGLFSVDTIATRYSYMVEGVVTSGIPRELPSFILPWNMPQADGTPITISVELLRHLLGPAFAIAMLGAIESLLCSVVADGLTGDKSNPDGELVGQGLGNIIVPFFGGITATAAIARTATSIRAGGRSPLASVFHSVTILAAMFFLAPLFGYIPMSALAAFLLIVAWNMSDAPHFIQVLRIAHKSDIMVMLTCFGLTVAFDMVIAIGIGIVLASLLFIRRMADLTGTEMFDDKQSTKKMNLPDDVAFYDINGPLFFGAAEKAMATMQNTQQVRAVIIDMTDVPMMDVTGLVALESTLQSLHGKGIGVVLIGLNQPVSKLLQKAGVVDGKDGVHIFADVDTARAFLG